MKSKETSAVQYMLVSEALLPDSDIKVFLFAMSITPALRVQICSLRYALARQSWENFSAFTTSLASMNSFPMSILAEALMSTS